jgi:hypothetical protein
LDQVCLVNLNADTFDSAAGRFVSADPVVADPVVARVLAFATGP